MSAHSNSAVNPPAGTWYQRLLIAIFSLLLTVLLFWLLGFAVDDLGNLPGPDRAALEAEMLDAKRLDTRKELTQQIAATERSMAAEQSRQRLLRESTTSSQNTLNQLLDIQRTSLQQNAKLAPEQQQALVESEQLFLQNQRKDQQLTDSISELSEKLNGLQEQHRVNEESLGQQQLLVSERFGELQKRHRLHKAALKLAILVPLLLIAAALFIWKRGSIYSPLIYAFGAATLVKIFIVMHEGFPAHYFKYVLVGSSIVAVAAVLTYLLRSRARPTRDALLKQYREAYETFFCPVCRYPIRRGPLRFACWSRRSIKRLQLPPEQGDDTPYTCPACGTTLFEACGRCGAVRHSLLPACVACGAAKDVV